MAALHVDTRGIPLRYFPRRPMRIRNRTRTEPRMRAGILGSVMLMAGVRMT